MLVLPFAAGVWLAEPTWTHLPLFALWIVGYLAYYAVGRWLRSQRKPRELPPVRAYAIACVPLAIGVLSLDASLLRWLPAFVPLLTASIWFTVAGRERSLANDTVVVLAAGLMAPVAFDAGDGNGWGPLWLVTGVLVAYFLGTVLYVKTMIRERGRRGYVVASVGYHLLVTVAVAGFTWASGATWWLAAVWVGLTGRALAGPLVTARRTRPLRPAVIGVGEIVASLIVTIVALATTAGT